MRERKWYRDTSKWHSEFSDWLRELEEIVRHETGRDPARRLPAEEVLRKSWEAKMTPWRFYDDNVNVVRGHNASIDDIPTLGED